MKLPRHRGLYQVEQLCGSGDVAGICNGQECAQLLEVHGQSSAMSGCDGVINNLYLMKPAIRFYDFFIATSPVCADWFVMDHTPDTAPSWQQDIFTVLKEGGVRQ